ncbi:bifunctional glycosyltransferase/CDP-glycerol:glycerophosphate glycerophosphotransferase [Streptomyces indicus]|uniref:bifunctional glycosyltransferase/CDP-glycerol:glycerophosphate glycerophosphotransferase n=1 Tax=Streptomyces indicus TaxID=417292 RepID=UPI000B897358|nr:bifunctional glycosyltransferase family 2 protein/CDP-glycerol:glycerophosphate glycerophosphotransferase [Streptomyces indicus]
MPRFSVIVPVFEVQGFLRGCLDSILGQSFTDLEVIAVDDCSPDDCGAILDAYAARDKRVRVVRTAAHAGPGPARDTGVAEACGDYLLFLDGDDSFTPGALAAIDERLRLTGDPDVLLFDHLPTHWAGFDRPSARAGLLAAAGRDTTDLPGSPQYLQLPLVAWNKAYRREFFRDGGFAFGAGLYEGVAVSCHVLAAARRIACLDRICVYVEQRRKGALSRTPGRAHFALFAQYDRLFALLDERPGLAPLRPLLFERAVQHCLATLTRPDRVLPRHRAEFHRELVRFHRRHKPAGFRPPPQDASRWHLLALGSYPLFRAHTLVTTQQAVLVRHLARLRDRAAGVLRRAVARFHRLRPLDPHLVVYAASGHRGVLGDPAAIHRAARTMAPHLRAVWVVDPQHAGQVPEGVDHVRPGSLRHLQVAVRATYFVNNVNWPDDLVKRPGQIHLHTGDGTPLTSTGLDLLGRPACTFHTDVRRLLDGADRWDHALVSSRYAERILARAYPCRFSVLRSGAPRNDVLVRGDEERAASVRARLGIPAGNTVLLYAPTRRDHRTWYVPRLDFEQLAMELGPRRTLLVRLHPQYLKDPVRRLQLRDLHRRGLLVDVTDEPAAEDLMAASDLLVTDYSSLMFDYALLDRPIVVHADDWEAVRASRGAYVDLLAEPPGHVTRSTAELADLITSGRWRDEVSAARRAAFREKFCTYEDGRAAERVVARVFLGRDHGPVTIPPQSTRVAPAESMAGARKILE